MFKIRYYMILSILLISQFSEFATYGISSNSVGKDYFGLSSYDPEVGIVDFYVHRWGIAVFDSSYQAFADHLVGYGELLSDIFTSLNYGRLSIVLGKHYPSKKLVYVSPLIMLGDRFSVNLSKLFGIDVGEIVFNKGDAVPLVLLVRMLEARGFVLNVTPLGFFGDNYSLSRDFFNSTSLFVLPYNYSERAIFPPAPILDPDNLGLYASSWGVISLFLGGFGGRVVFSDNRVDFYLFGENRSLINLDNGTVGVVLNAVFSYDRDTGVMVSSFVNATIDLYNDSRLVFSFHFELSMSYMGGKKLDFGLVDGEKLGFKIEEIYLNSGMLILLELLIGYDAIPFLNIDSSALDNLIEDLEKVNITLTYNDTLSLNGLELFFHTQIEAPNTTLEIINTTITTTNMTFVANISSNISVFYSLIPPSPYLVGSWEESAGLIQVSSDLVKVIDILNELSDTEIELKLSGYSKYLKYIKENETLFHAFIHGLFFKYKQPKIVINETTIPPIEAEGEVSLRYIYDANGYLVKLIFFLNISEIKVEILEGTYFMSENNTMIVVLSAVEKHGGEPNFNATKDAPELTEEGWVDSSLYQPNTVIGEIADKNAPKLVGIAVNPYYNKTGTFFEFKANITDENPIILARLDMFVIDTNDSVETNLRYDGEEEVYVAKVFIAGKVKEINFTVIAMDAFYNQLKETFTYKIKGDEGTNLLYLGLAIGIIVAGVGFIVFIKREE